MAECEKAYFRGGKESISENEPKEIRLKKQSLGLGE